MEMMLINDTVTSKKRKQAGFTLVEMMLALVLGSLVVVVILTIYKAQQRTYVAQDQVSEMQQNIRASLDTIVRESRMAAFNPSGVAGCAITAATRGRFSFTRDLNEDGDCTTCDATQPNECIFFGYPVADDSDAPYPDDGIPDSGAQALGMRTNGSGYQSIGENIQAIEFLYILDDGTGTLTRTTGAPIDTALSSTDIENIRAVRISILARASQSDRNFVNNITYAPASIADLDPIVDAIEIAKLQVGWGPFNDNFRRRFMVTTVQIRNMGLE